MLLKCKQENLCLKRYLTSRSFDKAGFKLKRDGEHAEARLTETWQFQWFSTTDASREMSHESKGTLRQLVNLRLTDNKWVIEKVDFEDSDFREQDFDLEGIPYREGTGNLRH